MEGESLGILFLLYAPLGLLDISSCCRSRTEERALLIVSVVFEYMFFKQLNGVIFFCMLMECLQICVVFFVPEVLIISTPQPAVVHG